MDEIREYWGVMRTMQTQVEENKSLLGMLQKKLHIKFNRGKFFLKREFIIVIHTQEDERLI